MTRIRATCPDCGEVELRPDDISLEIVRDDEGDIGDGSAYHFSCPDCLLTVTKPADERVARLLLTGGVAVTVSDGPEAGSAPAHPEQPAAGPAFTPDDLLAFHELLASDDWYPHLEALVR